MKAVFGVFLILPFLSFFPPEAHAAAASHLVISEIQTRGAAANDEFIELYNPTASAIDLSALPLKLHIINSAGTDQNRNLTFTNSTIAAYGFFLIGPSSGYTGSASLDATYTTTQNMLVDNGAVYISTSIAIDKTGLIDLVGFGSTSSSNREGTALANLSASTSYERKATVSSTSSTMASGGSEETYGNAEDTDDNSADFVSRASPQAQNSSSSTESLPSPTATPTPTPSPTPTPTPTSSSSSSSSSGGSSSNSSSNASTCSESAPSAPTIRSATRQTQASAHVGWTTVSDADTYAVSYGTKAGTYQFGISSTGNVDGVVINGLTENTYYFVVFAKKGCAISGPSSEVKLAGIPSQATQTSREGSEAAVLSAATQSATPTVLPTPQTEASKPAESNIFQQMINKITALIQGIIQKFFGT